MVRRKQHDDSFALLKDQHVTTIDAAQALDDFMAQYAGAVITDRALPEIDGLKPVQRRLLYTMWKLGLMNGKTTKLNNVGGTTMLLHPHGDASPFVYTLAAAWENNVPLAKIIGNGGTIDKGVDGAAAPRYTSATLTKAAEHMLAGLKEQAVDMVPSYDGERLEPKLLPGEFPNAFMNAVQGIAVGMRTNMIPHNPKEIINGMLYYIDHPKTTAEKLSTFIQGPDFPTGGLLVDSKSANINELKYGRSIKGHSDKYVIRGEAKLHKTKQAAYIEFVSIPYGVLLEDVIDSLMKFQQKHADLGIQEVLDSSSDYNRISIKVTFKKRTSKEKLQQVLALIYQATLMQNTISPINTMIANGYPKTVSIMDYFSSWLKFRRECLRRQFVYEQEQALNRQEIVQGLLKLVEIADQVVTDAKQSKNKVDFERRLQKNYQFTYRQAHAIAGMALYRFGRQDVTALRRENKQLAEKLTKLTQLLASEHALTLEIKRQLRALNKTIFKNCTRQTRLVAEDKLPEVTSVSMASLVKKQSVVVVAKSTGVVQRMSPAVYQNNIDKYENKSQIVAKLDGNTQQGAMFFTKDGLSYVRMVKDLINANVRTEVDSVQREIADYKSTDETIGGTVFDLPMCKHPQILVAVTKLGRVKLVDLPKIMPSTSTKRYLKHMQTYFGLRDQDDEVIFAKTITIDEQSRAELTIHRNVGRTKQKVIDLSKFNVQGGTGAGTREWKLNGDERVDGVKLVINDKQ